jgi:hypothetical protein
MNQRYKWWVIKMKIKMWLIKLKYWGIGFLIVIIIIGFLTLWVIVSYKVVSAVSQVGIKTIAERVWYGEKGNPK